MVKAKFKCDEVRRQLTMRDSGQKNELGSPIYKPVEMQTIIMSPVYGNGDPNHENTKFWNASPSGKLELGCINLAAAEQFELGKEYYLTFEQA